MNDFDKMLRDKAKSESIVVPPNFDRRINDVMKNLSNDTSNRRKKISPKILIAAAGLSALLAVSAVAAPTLISMSKGTIDYFNLPQEMRFLSKQAQYQKYNSEVGVTVEDQGITVQIDNIAVDDNYINVFYTVKSDRPIELPGDEESPHQWRTNWAVPHFWFKADGKYIKSSAQLEHEGYLVDEYTLVCMERYTVIDVLPDNFKLEIYADEIWNTKGEWSMALSVDKSAVAVDSLTVTPKISAKVTSGWEEKTYKHNITIDKVSISPFGSQIVISQRGENFFTDFILRDEQGKYLPVIPAGTFSSFMKIANSFEFISTNTNMKSIALIPLNTDGQGNQEIISIDNLPVAMPLNDLGGYVLENLTIDDKKMVATLQMEGVIPTIAPTFKFVDRNGEYLNYITHIDEVYDRTNAKVTLTGYLAKDITDDDLSKIAGISYFSNYDIKLNESEAITIPLK